MSAPLRIGIIGVGNISGQYLAAMPTYPTITITAVADLHEDRAAAAAASLGAAVVPVSDLLASPDVDLVLNLTTPASHAPLALQSLAAGKHYYGEKPLALTFAEGQAIMAAATAAGLAVGSAPDTVLGTGIQTSRQLIEEGRIGDVVGAMVHWSAPGHELWHPNPAFYYQPGAGPLFDMGPYYLSALVHLLGPIARVTGVATRSDRSRTVATGPLAGQAIPVDVATHVTALLQHASGTVSTVTVSFDVWATRAPLFEVYGTQGSLGIPDPNQFSDTTLLWTPEVREWAEVAPTAGYRDGARGVGVADLAARLAHGEPPRASGDVGLHVLEVMEAILASADGQGRDIGTRPEVPTLVALSGHPG